MANRNTMQARQKVQYLTMILKISKVTYVPVQLHSTNKQGFLALVEKLNLLVFIQTIGLLNAITDYLN
jgi:hypothetical protein